MSDDGLRRIERFLFRLMIGAAILAFLAYWLPQYIGAFRVYFSYHGLHGG